MNPLFQVTQDIDRICRTRGLNPNNPEQEALILDVLKVKWDLKDPAAPVLLQPGSKAVVDGFLGVELTDGQRMITQAFLRAMVLGFSRFGNALSSDGSYPAFRPSVVVDADFWRSPVLTHLFEDETEMEFFLTKLNGALAAEATYRFDPPIGSPNGFQPPRFNSHALSRAPGFPQQGSWAAGSGSLNPPTMSPNGSIFPMNGQSAHAYPQSDAISAANAWANNLDELNAHMSPLHPGNPEDSQTEPEETSGKPSGL